MNGYRAFGVSTLLSLTAAALALGVGLGLAPAASARAAPAPEFVLDFPGLVPGVPQTDTGAFILERDAHLVSFDWLERSGLLADESVTIDIEVCDSAQHCVDPTGIDEPVRFAAGAGEVTVTVALVAATDGEAGSMTGRLSFLADESLAATGGDGAPWIAAGIAAIAVGALGLALTLRSEGASGPRKRPGRRSPGWGERDRA